MKSPVPWMGGKRRLASKIMATMPAHTCYVEVFAGSGSILFSRDEPAQVEVLNDINQELVNFYRVLKHHLDEFCRQFRWALNSRKMFEWLQETPPETLTDIQRAARFFYLLKLCFGAKPTGQSFGTSTTSKPKLNLLRLEEDLSAAHLRLAQVYIEALDWHRCIDRYDRPHTLFFLDPPYWELAGYGPTFPIMEYEALATTMGRISGKAILTINDHPDMRTLFKRFNSERVKITYTVGGKPKQATEIIYRNW